MASIPVEELTDVRSLKQQLNRVHGFPTRFRQRLLLGDKPLADSTLLDSPMDLALVVLMHSAASQAQLDELVAAAANGSPSEVRNPTRGLRL